MSVKFSCSNMHSSPICILAVVICGQRAVCCENSQDGLVEILAAIREWQCGRAAVCVYVECGSVQFGHGAHNEVVAHML